MSATAALLAIQGLANIGQGFANNRAANQQIGLMNERAAELGGLSQEMIDAGMTGRNNYGLGRSYQNLRAEINEDPTRDYLTRQSSRIEGEGMSALRSGGARALIGGTSKMADATSDRLMKIAADANLRRRQGLQVVGEAEQRVARENLADARTDLAFGRGLGAESRSARYGAEDLEVARRNAALNAAISGAGGLATAGIAQWGDLSKTDPNLIAMLMRGFGGTPTTNG
jgi:hypothetical protein